MADIEGMFHQARVNENDSNLLRFLWWPNGDVTKPLEQYRMKVHLFDAISSPSCANFALKKTAEDNKISFSPAAVETIKLNFYMDDCLKSVPTEKAAINLVKELSELCAKGRFRLTKWVSNSRVILSTISNDNKAKQIKELDLDRDKLPVFTIDHIYCGRMKIIYNIYISALFIKKRRKCRIEFFDFGFPEKTESTIQRQRVTVQF